MKKENASLHWTVALYLTLSTICVTANKLYPMEAAIAAEDNMANPFDDVISSSKSNVPVVDSNELFPEMVHEEDDDICQVDALPLDVHTTFTLECKGKDVKLTVGGKVYTATQPTHRYSGQLIVYAGDPWFDAAKAQINRLNYKILPTAAGINAALENYGMNLAEKQDMDN
eukprot:Em0001g3165a